jgi:hypothetical protein
MTEEIPQRTEPSPIKGMQRLSQFHQELRTKGIPRDRVGELSTQQKSIVAQLGEGEFAGKLPNLANPEEERIFVGMRELVHIAAQTLGDVANSPQMVQALEDIERHLVLSSGDREDQSSSDEQDVPQTLEEVALGHFSEKIGKINQLNTGIWRTGETFNLVMGKIDVSHLSLEDTAFYLVIISHELGHALERYFLGATDMQLGFAQRLEANTLQEEDFIAIERRGTEAHLEAAFSEATALAAEHEVIRYLSEDTTDDAVKNRLLEFSEGRRAHLRVREREKHGAQDTRWFNYQHNYPEGFKIALALRRNGWSLADLPQLTEGIKPLFDVSGAMPSAMFRSPKLSLKQDSDYQNLLLQLLAQRKPASAREEES